jgi:hypothetical protein
MPKGRCTHLDPQIVQEALPKLRQGQVLLLANPGSQAPIMAFQTTAAIASALLGFEMAGALILVPVPLDAALGDPK